MKSESALGEIDIEVNYINYVDRSHRKKFGQFFLVTSTSFPNWIVLGQMMYTFRGFESHDFLHLSLNISQHSPLSQ
jgi:hypothetical protein